ncbi:recombination mediator RecR [Halothiobacillus sp. DCM-1]|uniref:recombination mediator RecR n=1 Tax=Halothiobacillus sp. DCM-1 TaxID=3112558 RepID=UPI00324C3B0E
MFSAAFDDLVQALRRLPSVGQKTAQRMALHLLTRDRAGAERIVSTLATALTRIGHCRQCHILSETELCPVCTDSQRDAGQLCVVESPTDWLAIEQSGVYRGRYFVLNGRLSPLDGLGPEEIGLPALLAHLAEQPVEELILALSATLEGEATADFIEEQAAAFTPQITRLAQGVPIGGELEYLDPHTLNRAFAGRRGNR